MRFLGISLLVAAALATGITISVRHHSTTSASSGPDKQQVMTAPTAPEPNPPATIPEEDTVEEQQQNKPLPFYGNVETIDSSGKSFTITNRSGKVQTFAITERTVISRDGKPATFEDLKAGESIRGQRIWIHSAQWEVLKLTLGAKVPSKKNKS